MKRPLAVLVRDRAGKIRAQLRAPDRHRPVSGRGERRDRHGLAVGVSKIAIHQNRRGTRNANDFVVLSPAGQSAPIRKEIESWLESRGLTLNATKSRTVNVTQEAIRFLGFTVKVRRNRNGRSYPHVEASGESCRSLRGKVSRILNHRPQW